VTEVDDRVRRLIDDMFETMYAAPGIGLAAIQVNVPLRVVTIDISEERDRPLALVNPEILEREGVEEMDEGCLSVPGVYENGKLFVDYLSNLKRQRIRKKLEKEARQAQPVPAGTAI